MESRIQGVVSPDETRVGKGVGDFISKVIHGIKLRAFLQSPIPGALPGPATRWAEGGEP
ncbi:hypothetical protein ACFPTY_14335 [Halomonas beimenensis]|uniref:hypothetical protein n=1 Tax=Halomonas beimenensis TaxID=475662 RepID=UPI003623CCCB